MVSKSKCVLNLLPLHKPSDRIGKTANSAPMKFVETNVYARKLAGWMEKDTNLVLVCTANRTESAVCKRSKTRITAGRKGCVRELLQNIRYCHHPVDTTAVDSTATFIERASKSWHIIELKEEQGS